MKFYVAMAILLFAGTVTAAESSYCDYTIEKYKAEQLLLQSPKLTFGGGRDSIGSANAIGLGVTESLSGYMKGRLSSKIGQQDCDLYRHVNEITKHVSYDVPTLQVSYAQHRIQLIDDAIVSLQKLQQEESERVKAGTSTIVVLDLVNSATEKLRVERTSLQQQVAVTVLPEELNSRLDQLLLETTEIENSEQQIIASQSKYDNWDVSVSTGIGSQIKGIVPSAPVQPFVLMSFSYSFGAPNRNKALDRSASSYAQYALTQQTGPVHLAQQLYRQIDSSRTVNVNALTSYSSYEANLRKNLDDVSKIDSPEGQRFKTQLMIEIALASVETESTKYNVKQLNTYLQSNFKED